MYINVDMQAIVRELSSLALWADAQGRQPLSTHHNWERYAPTLNDIKNLNKGYKISVTENFYDSEPDYDDETFHMYMDYCCTHPVSDEISGTALYDALTAALGESAKNSDGPIKNSNKPVKKFSKKNHSNAALEKAYHKICKMQEDYEPRRIAFGNWTELYEEGNWGLTQAKIDTIAKSFMRTAKNAPKTHNIDNHDRFWILKPHPGALPFPDEKDKYSEDIIIYYYGRDYLCADYVWFLHKI